jgi:hypothetical protein
MIECFAICIVLILCVEVHLIFLICIAIFICTPWSSLLAESITMESKKECSIICKADFSK